MESRGDEVESNDQHDQSSGAAEVSSYSRPENLNGTVSFFTQVFTCDQILYMFITSLCATLNLGVTRQ